MALASQTYDRFPDLPAGRTEHQEIVHEAQEEQAGPRHPLARANFSFWLLGPSGHVRGRSGIASGSDVESTPGDGLKLTPEQTFRLVYLNRHVPKNSDLRTPLASHRSLRPSTWKDVIRLPY